MRDQLLAAVLENPTREICAVYADFLLEAGDPRGELIGVDLALSERQPMPRRQRLMQRRRELLRAHKWTWWGALRHFIGDDPATHYGFLTAARGTPAQLLAGGDALFAAEPIRGLHVHAVDDRLGELLARPWLARVRRLHLEGGLADAGFAELTAAPTLAGLAELRVTRSEVRAAGLAALAGRLPALRRLSLAMTPIGNAGAAALAAWEQLPRQRGLALERAELGVAGLTQLLARGPFAQLRELRLSGNPLGDVGAIRLCGRAESFPALTSLYLSGTGLGSAGVEPFLAGQWPRLVRLWLEGNFEIEDDVRDELRERFRERVVI